MILSGPSIVGGPVTAEFRRNTLNIRRKAPYQFEPESARIQLYYLFEDQMKPTTEQMSEALDIIHDIAVKVDEKDPAAVERAFNDIIALARYKFDVIGQKRKDSH